MVLGQKLWEGKGKSVGTGLIKSVGIESITSEFSWRAQVKGMGCARRCEILLLISHNHKY